MSFSEPQTMNTDIIKIDQKRRTRKKDIKRDFNYNYDDHGDTI